MPKVIIIGASSGIGRELARIYAHQGYEVGIAGRRADLLDALSVELGGCARMVVDVTRTDEAMARVEKFIRDMKDVDVFIISAGTGHINQDLNWSKERDTLDTNVTGFAAMANVAWRYFHQKGSGHLVGISSVAAIRGSAVAPAYNASKAFISVYMEGLQARAAKSGLPICVSDIRPGLVDTAMAKGEGLFWVAPVEKAAQQIYQAIVRRRKRAYITRRWALVAGLLKVLPDWLYHRL